MESQNQVCSFDCNLKQYFIIVILKDEHHKNILWDHRINDEIFNKRLVCIKGIFSSFFSTNQTQVHILFSTWSNKLLDGRLGAAYIEFFQFHRSVLQPIPNTLYEWPNGRISSIFFSRTHCACLGNKITNWRERYPVEHRSAAI